jgi:hypothetical protein
VMQPEDEDEDGTIDRLHSENIRAMKGNSNAYFSQPPRFRKLAPVR